MSEVLWVRGLWDKERTNKYQHSAARQSDVDQRTHNPINLLLSVHSEYDLIGEKTVGFTSQHLSYKTDGRTDGN